MPAGPGDVRGLAQLEQEVEFLLKKRVVILQVEAEEGIRLGERATAGNDFGPALRDQIQRGEFLEDAHRIRRAEHRDCAGQPDALGPCRGGRQDDRRRGVEVIAAVVLTDPEGIQADLVREFHFIQQVAQALDRRDGDALRIRGRRRKTVDADLHDDAAQKRGGRDAGPSWLAQALKLWRSSSSR